jgi:hypothetical protein
MRVWAERTEARVRGREVGSAMVRVGDVRRGSK